MKLQQFYNWVTIIPTEGATNRPQKCGRSNISLIFNFAHLKKFKKAETKENHVVVLMPAYMLALK